VFSEKNKYEHLEDENIAQNDNHLLF